MTCLVNSCQGRIAVREGCWSFILTKLQRAGIGGYTSNFCLDVATIINLATLSTILCCVLFSLSWAVSR